MYSNPMPNITEVKSHSRSLPSSIYSRQYYLDFCGGYAEFLNGSIPDRLRQALNYGQLAESMNVLDIGCGRGELALGCAELGCSVWGTDYSLEALTLAEEFTSSNLKMKIQKRIRLQQMNAKHLAFPPRTFDRVFLIDVVEHLYPEELERVFREVKRVIKPGGRVVVHTAPNAWLIRPIYFLAGLLFGWRKHPFHVNEQSYFSLRSSLRQLDGRTSAKIISTPGFFRLGVGPDTDPSSLRGVIAGLVDGVLDHPAVRSLVTGTPLKLILGTDLWATVDIPKVESAKE